MVRAKVCGITTVEDAEHAAEAGAWALGMIFVRSSPRRCRPADAERIAAALHRRVELAGVFANAPLADVVRLADRARLSLVQLHGDEGPSFCTEVARRTGARVIKAVRVRSGADAQALGAFRDVDFHLMDGGGGEPFAWELVRRRPSTVPLIVAGGLTPGNVADAIAATRPWGVDAASGLDAEPGRKDHALVEAFLEAVRAASPGAEGAAA